MLTLQMVRTVGPSGWYKPVGIQQPSPKLFREVGMKLTPADFYYGNAGHPIGKPQAEKQGHLRLVDHTLAQGAVAV